MKKISLFFVLFITLIGVHAQTIQTAPVKPNPTVNYERLKRVDELLNNYIKEQKIVGAVALIIKDGQVIKHQGYGMDDVATKRTMPKDGIFRIASQTKAITSVGIMLLIEEGKLLLNDPVSKYIPAFKNPVVLDQYNEKDTTYTTVPARREITIKDLLTHTSGLGYALIGSPRMQAIYYKHGIPSGVGEMHADISETMQRLGKLPLEYQPGTRYNYSLSTDVLGHVIEVVSGMDLETFFQKRIFTPLGMKDTYFNLPVSKHQRLTEVYTLDSLGKWVKFPGIFDIPADFPNKTKRYFSGGGGLASTALDYGIFLQMLLNKGTYNGVTLLSPRSVAMMTTNQIGNLGGNFHFGLGFGITAEAAADEIYNPGTYYWGGAFATTYWVDPQAQLIAVLMSQQFNAPPAWGELQQKFGVAVYQSLK
ncbi:MAG: serine hydrolase domain-containing protein [Saprospiraceae bacterium]